MEGQQTEETAGIDPMAAEEGATANVGAVLPARAAPATAIGETDRVARTGFADDAMTGTPDPIYNLISVLYHTLRGAEASMIYAGDAAFDDDAELVQFFEEIQQQDRWRAERAKQLLRRCLGDGSPS